MSNGVQESSIGRGIFQGWTYFSSLELDGLACTNENMMLFEVSGKNDMGPYQSFAFYIECYGNEESGGPLCSDERPLYL